MTKKLLIIILFLVTFPLNSFSIEPEIFVQSTVNRASKLLSENISKEEKITKLKSIAKETVNNEDLSFKHEVLMNIFNKDDYIQNLN